MKRNASTLLIAAVVSAAVILLFAGLVLVTPSGHPQNCPNAPAQSSGSVALFANGTTFTAPFVFPFCINTSVTLVGAWSASQPTATAVLFQNETQFGWPCPGCYAANGTYNVTLFPGSYDFDMLPENQSASDIITVTQLVELLYDRTTIVLEPTGTQTVNPSHYLDWTLSVPPNASRVAFYSYDSISGGFQAGLLNPMQWAAFLVNPASFEWGSLYWGASSTGGAGGELGPVLAWGGDLGAAVGNYTIVFYNDGTSSDTIQFLTPLYLAYNDG